MIQQASYEFIKYNNKRGVGVFNRANVGFNRVSKWNRVILSIRQLTEAIPVYFKTRIEFIVDMIR